MASIDEIIDIQITRNTQVVDEADFNTVLLLTEEKVASDVVSRYHNLDEVLAAGYGTTSNTYKAAASYFAQNPRPTELLVGRRESTILDVTLPESAITNSTNYSITVAGFTATFASSATAEADKPQAIEDILTGLQALLVAESTVTDVATPTVAGLLGAATLTLTQVALMTMTITGPESGMVYAFSGLATMANALSSIKAVDNNWYLIASTSHDVTDVTNLAAVIEADQKLYLTSSQHADSLAAVSVSVPATANDVLGKLWEAKYDRTSGVYSADADNNYIEMAWLGKKALAVPGATTWMFATFSAIVADNLTATQSANVRNKEGNTYEPIAGVNIMREGTVASGEYIDIMRGADDLHSRIQVEMYRALILSSNSGSKIALTDAGVATLKGIVETELTRSQTNNFIPEYLTGKDASGRNTRVEAFEVRVEPVSSLTSNQRANREAPTITFVAAVAGAVHKGRVRGNLYV